MFQPLRLVAATLLFCAMPLASASVLTFDDLTGTVFFTANYQGFQFGTNSASTNAFFHSNIATPYYKPVGGTGSFIAVDYTIYDNLNPYQGTTAASLAGPQQLITNSTPFIFNGAFFTGADTIGYKLYSGTTVVYTTLVPTVIPIGAAPLFVASGFNGLVTGVEIFGRQGFYALDNFTYDLAAAAVPEPASLALLVIGVLGAGAVARRRGTRPSAAG